MINFISGLIKMKETYSDRSLCFGLVSEQTAPFSLWIWKNVYYSLIEVLKLL